MNPVDIDEVRDTIDLIIDYYEQEGLLKDIVSNIQVRAECIELEDREWNVYVSTRKDLVKFAKEENSLIVYGNDDFDSDLVDALFWITAASPTGEPAFIVTHAYVTTGEMV